MVGGCWDAALAEAVLSVAGSTGQEEVSARPSATATTPLAAWAMLTSVTAKDTRGRYLGAGRQIARQASVWPVGGGAGCSHQSRQRQARQVPGGRQAGM